MKEVLVTIKVTLNEDVYNDFIADGYSEQYVTHDKVTESFNSAKVPFGLIEDFEVESVKEVKEE